MLAPRPSKASITPLPGLAGSIGVPEASSGMPSPPLSPPLAARNAPAVKISNSDITSRSGRARRGGAAYTITGECERLFCGTLRAVFLGEGNLARQDSLVTGMQKQDTIDINDYGVQVRRHTDGIQDLPLPEADGFVEKRGLVSDWVEIWDYVGGNKFRGFVAENEGEKAMFVFFDQSVIGGDLKSGLMALLELCDIPYFSCSRLVVCLDRHAELQAMNALTKDLGWIGFQLATLNDFTRGDEIISNQWLFMEMEV
ncbi:hypothetical protein K469DRAFT_699256 [Zopfia rhizophila CBS 207.26]|uniref:Ornithine decarboxylase antizyme n=1 Tax=Zopfia rhizophila CBS 207.26 TaxID=1314779 RepID=A0A6A6EWL6_9PEZI|nr:hypothetical protein K469DRAFT_699256 [Zopfia rhizophila CBS 207.26]